MNHLSKNTGRYTILQNTTRRTNRVATEKNKPNSLANVSHN